MIGFIYIEEQGLKGDNRRVIWKISDFGRVKDLGFTEEKR